MTISLDSLSKSIQLVVTTLDVFRRKQVIIQSIVKGSLTHTKIRIVLLLHVLILEKEFSVWSFPLHIHFIPLIYAFNFNLSFS